ncbi:FAD-dependent monooxygenase [Propioniciclava sp.]|uniref:FAD-dependent monooxygenase n=1 Tax=Propioniciclava sp. TaxID=2038686 RepID=UPI00262B86C9|nr:FAD-dependent monooxygenase [Propioniciclava sp.]
MQFYLDGYVTGDPEVAPAVLPAEVDVLVVGTGPAGVVLAAQLATHPEIRTAVVERRDGPLQLGHADGVACRSVEMFATFGVAERLLREAYWVNETTFWTPSASDPATIERTDRIQDVEDGLSEMPHVIVNQARIHQYLLDVMADAPTRLRPHYGWRAVDVQVGEGDHPVVATLEDAAGARRTVRAKYVVGCDGARSAVREALGLRMVGDVANHAWGVLDVLAVTDFPDIRLKSIIRSQAGSIICIPREGGYLVRLYVDLGDLDPGRHLTKDEVGLDRVIAKAQAILHPYALDVRSVAWWSIYEVGQRVTNFFDDTRGDPERDPRVFIAGDACHTHSAKAGQGMNVSMADAFNLGWKLVSVLTGRAAPSLLRTYSGERRPIAQELIDFDREFAARMSAKGDDAEYSHYFARQLRFTAGVSTLYPPSELVAAGARQGLATGFGLGMRFHTAPVVRLYDARRLELGHCHRADAAWRLYLFADAADPADPDAPVNRVCAALEPVLARFTPAGLDPDAVVDVRAVFAQGHRTVDPTAPHALLRPAKGRYGLQDHEKMFCVDPAADIYAARGIAPEGCMVLVRPDQFVAHLLPLDPDAVAELDAFLSGVLLPQR